MLADRVRMGSYKPSLGVPITIEVQYMDTPPDGYDIAFIPFISDPPEWTSSWGNIFYDGQPISYSDYQTYTGTPISLMTAHITPIVVNTIETSRPMIGFKIKEYFGYARLFVNGVQVSRELPYVSGSPDNAYGVFFLPTNLVAGDEVVLGLRRRS